MKSFLRNYTSSVSVSQTIHRIEEILIRCGVTAVAKEYGDQGKVLAITFQLPAEDGIKMSVRLPADEQAAIDMLWKDYEATHPHKYRANRKSRKDFVEQGQRTAWKLVQEWIEIEMSRVQMRQGEIREIFLAYIWSGSDTLYQRIKANGFRALLPEKCEP